MNKSNKLLSLFETFHPAELDSVVEKLQAGIKAPYVKVYKSTLGGIERPTVMITVSMDSKETWAYGIIENSRYFKMSYQKDGTMEVFTAQYRMNSKFRKTKAKSIDDAIAKINKFIELQGQT